MFRAASAGLKRWLNRARDAVMAPFRQFKAQPNPQAITATVPLWQAQVDRIVAALTPALIEGWAGAHLPGDYDPRDPYIQANLALTYNLLVRIPDEVHAKVVKEILEGTNAGETVQEIAHRVDDVLDYTGSEKWPDRARLIAQTETTRHAASSMLAHALLVEKQDKRSLMKRWDTIMDNRERDAHRYANGQTVPLGQPFLVEGFPMMHPGDPKAPPALVCNCVPSWQEVSVRATGFMQRAFSGMLVNLVTSDGYKLSATPNHPVLARRGWLPIGSLDPTDEILCCSDSWATAGSVNPHITQRQPTADQVASLLQLTPRAHKGMPATFVNFDGDVIDRDVNIVRTDDLLTLGFYAQQLEQLGHLSIHGGYSQMSFACHTPSVEIALESDPVGLAAGSRYQSQVKDRATNPITANAKFQGHGSNRQSSVVHQGHSLLERLADSNRRAGIESMLMERGIDDPGRDAKMSPYGASGKSSMMKGKDFPSVLHSYGGPGSAFSWHRISSLTRQRYVGTVYDFETVDGLFAAGGVVVANCRCSLHIQEVA